MEDGAKHSTKPEVSLQENSTNVDISYQSLLPGSL
jgi:hypothetical protein